MTVSHLLTRGQNVSVQKRKEREKRARKKLIMEAAKKVFFDKGFQSTTMDQIAEEAELSKGALYLYFQTKEELYVSILVEGLEKLRERFEMAVKGVDDWETQARNIGKAYYAFYREDKNYFNILFFLQHGEVSSKVSESLSQECHEMGLSCLSILAGAVEKGIALGEVREQNPMELAVILWGSLNGIILLSEEEEHEKYIPSPLDQMILSSLNLLIDGLRKR
jgi:AcrR family transcriptional regulator